MLMRIKIHMLNIGDADSIIVQLEDPFKNQLTLLVDGGESGHAKTIIGYFAKINDVPDIIISTHLDSDHVGGLRGVIEAYGNKIEAIWAHRPEEHVASLKDIILEKAQRSHDYVVLNASIDDLNNFIDIAERNKIKILEPFSNKQPPEIKEKCSQWGIKILGPSVDFYEDQIERCKEDFILGMQGEAVQDLSEYVIKAITNPCANLGGGIDTPTNESSIIFQIDAGFTKYLFTGDAGLCAFNDIKGKLEKIDWLKVPHHGSRKNLDSEIINILQPTTSFIPGNNPNTSLIGCLENHGNVKWTGKEGVLIKHNYQ